MMAPDCRAIIVHPMWDAIPAARVRGAREAALGVLDVVRGQIFPCLDGVSLGRAAQVCRDWASHDGARFHKLWRRLLMADFRVDMCALRLSPDVSAEKVYRRMHSSRLACMFPGQRFGSRGGVELRIPSCYVRA